MIVSIVTTVKYLKTVVLLLATLKALADSYIPSYIHLLTGISEYMFAIGVQGLSEIFCIDTDKHLLGCELFDQKNILICCN